MVQSTQENSQGLLQPQPIAPSLFLFAEGEHAPNEPDWRGWVHRLATDASDRARV
jgi:hypothetical protein